MALATDKRKERQETSRGAEGETCGGSSDSLTVVLRGQLQVPSTLGLISSVVVGDK